MIDIDEKNWYWITATILAVLVSGSWYYLAPTEKYDVCRSWEYGEWVNVTETIYVNNQLLAVGKYRCDIEDKELWCGRTTRTRCYYILEEGLIPKDMSSHGTTWDKTEMANGNTNIVLYSGTRNVFENGKWVRVENSTGSLKKYFNVKYIDDDDPSLNMTVKDFGYKWIDLEFMIKDTKHLRKMIPVKLDGVKIKDFLWNGISDKRNHRVEVNNTLNHTYGFGKESTTIKLQDANTENLEDTEIILRGVAYDRGSCTTMYSYTSPHATARTAEPVIMFNISSIPEGMNIDEAKLALYIIQYTIDNGEGIHVSLHDVYKNNWTEGNACTIAGCSGSEMCYNTRPSPSEHNTTREDRITFEGTSPTPGLNSFAYWTATESVSNSYENNGVNASFWLKSNISLGEPGSNDFVRFVSKEYTTDVTRRPFLNITYSAPTPANCWNLDDMYVPRDDPEGGDCEYFTLGKDFSI